MTQSCGICGALVTRPFLSGDLRDREYGTPWSGTILRCEGCSLPQQSPMLTTEQAVALYPPNYRHYTRKRSRIGDLLMQMHTARTVGKMRRLGIGPGHRILDIGCGSGQPLSIITKALGCEGIGVEPSASAAEQARREFGMTVYTGTFPHADLAGQSFDAVYLNHVIEHVPDPVGLLQSILAVLKPGGYLIGETENVGSLSSRLFKQYWALLHLPYHLYFFDEKTLRRPLADAGFGAIDIGTVTDATAWSLSIQNVLRRNVEPGRQLAARMPGYVPLTLGCVPLSWLEHGQGPILTFTAQRPATASS